MMDLFRHPEDDGVGDTDTVIMYDAGPSDK